jgi:hypothetical protein
MLKSLADALDAVRGIASPKMSRARQQWFEAYL